MNRFNNFDINELQIIRKTIIFSIKKNQFQGKELGKVNRLWAELDTDLENKMIMHQLCSLPKELLIKRLNGDIDNSYSWLETADQSYILSAIEHYDDDVYIKMRKMRNKEKEL